MMNENAYMLIEKLADKLGTTAEHLWSVLVAQAPIQAVAEICTWLIATTIITILYIFLWKRIDKYSDYDDRVFQKVMLGIPFIFLFMALIVSIPIWVSAFANPEYWALMEIAKMF
jgi:hypothetical protein